MSEALDELEAAVRQFRDSADFDFVDPKRLSAVVDGLPVWVTAVLERTAVVEPAPGEPKMLVNRSRCLVNPNDIRYGYVAARHAAKRGREAARRNRQASK